MILLRIPANLNKAAIWIFSILPCINYLQSLFKAHIIIDISSSIHGISIKNFIEIE